LFTFTNIETGLPFCNKDITCELSSTSTKYAVEDSYLVPIIKNSYIESGAALTDLSCKFDGTAITAASVTINEVSCAPTVNHTA